MWGKKHLEIALYLQLRLKLMIPKLELKSPWNGQYTTSFQSHCYASGKKTSKMDFLFILFWDNSQVPPQSMPEI